VIEVDLIYESQADLLYYSITWSASHMLALLSTHCEIRKVLWSLNSSQAHGLPITIVATSPGKPWVASLGFEAIDSDPKWKQKFPRVHSRLCFSHLVRISLISCNLIFAGMINSVLVASPACPICRNDHEGSLLVISIFILQSIKPWVVLRGFVSCYQWKVPS
jgi:hypothetical protein